MFITINDPDPATPAEADPAPVDAAAEALAALEEGIAAADEGGPVPQAPVEGEEAAPEGEPEAAPAASPEAAPEAAPEAKPDDTEAEINALGLKEKSAERFRAMAGEIKELAPIRDELARIGIKDASGVSQLVAQADAGIRMVEMVRETGSTAEQYGEVMDYMALQNQAISTGDPALAKKALERLRPALEGLAKIAGEEVPGYDPLAGHPDLQADVESGDLSAKRAKELAAQRDREATMSTIRQSQRQATDAEERRAHEQQQAFASGQQSLNALEARLSADPHFATKRPQLVEAVRQIVAQHPPSQWASEAAIAYAAINVAPPMQPVAQQPSRPMPGPVRGGSHRMALTPETDDPLKALEIGIELANGQ
jgi:hypothetical protein